MSSTKLLTGLLVMALTVTACRAGESATPEPSEPPTEEPGSPSPSIGVPADPEDAIVRIESTGTFYDPLEGTGQETVTGSGFIIDSSGLVVTNNHVVAGGTAWNVFIRGEEPAYHARLIGTSECDDLAVLQLQGVDDELPTLRWHAPEVEPGLEVHSAGFPPNPEGDYVYRSVPGEVTSAATSLSTDWAAIDQALEHSATIRGGNSGGPLLVDADNSVAGVNYASTGTDSYAIAADAAQETVEVLSRGEDLNSIGISGRAIVSDDGSLFGVWVSGVKGGSPAHNASVLAGDLITHVNGVAVGRDGTLEQYCDILRSQGPTAQLDLQIANFDDETCYIAYLNRPGRSPDEVACDIFTGDEDRDEQTLNAILNVHVPDSVRTTCLKASEDETYSRALVSMSCDGPGGTLMYYDLFDTVSAIEATYDTLSEAAGVVDGGDCQTGPAEGGWLADEQPAGRYACYESDSGSVWLVFTDTNALVIGTLIADPGEWSVVHSAFFDGDIWLP